MRGNLNSRGAFNLINNAITSLAGEGAVKKAAPVLDAAFELARQTALTSLRGKREVIVKSVQVTLHDGENRENGGTGTTIIAKGSPVGSGPGKRTPIRVGGGHCVTIQLSATVKVTVCVEWQSA